MFKGFRGVLSLAQAIAESRIWLSLSRMAMQVAGAMNQLEIFLSCGLTFFLEISTARREIDSMLNL